MIRALPLLPLLMLAACGDGQGTQIAIRGDNGQDLVAVGKDGNVKIDAPGFKASVNLPKVALDTDNFDINGVKLPAGSSISDMAINGEGDGNVRVNFTSPVGAVGVREWFQGRLRAEGFNLSADGNGLTGTTDDGKPFRLQSRDTRNGASESTITIGG